MKDVQYTHSLTQLLNTCLFRFARAGGRGRVADILNHSQTCNFHKLRYWKLVEKLGGGEWAITKDGYDFLDHKISVPEKVITYRGEVVRYEGLPVFTSDLPPAVWTRNEYAKHAQKIQDEQARLF